ncbi:MAG: hypothetical protein SGJ24_07180 [Chloroflexota bacterium]|nr:hypothetical protein [Chloroflexota bacterium]
MRKITFTLGLVTALILGACNFFAPSSDIQTENLQNDVARTQIAAIRASATVDAERLAITAEYASGSIANAALQSTRIVSTLMAQGTRFIDLPPLPETRSWRRCRRRWHPRQMAPASSAAYRPRLCPRSAIR